MPFQGFFQKGFPSHTFLCQLVKDNDFDETVMKQDWGVLFVL